MEQLAAQTFSLSYGALKSLSPNSYFVVVVVALICMYCLQQF